MFLIVKKGLVFFIFVKISAILIRNLSNPLSDYIVINKRIQIDRVRDNLKWSIRKVNQDFDLPELNLLDGKFIHLV